MATWMAKGLVLIGVIGAALLLIRVFSVLLALGPPWQWFS